MIKPQKYVIKCKIHEGIVQKLCVHPSCINILICENCQESHPQDHHKHLVKFEDVYNCSIMKNLTDQIESQKSKDAKKKFETEQSIAKVKTLFDKIEHNLIAKLREVQETIKTKLSEQLKNNVETDYLANLKERLSNKHSIAMQKDFSDESTLNDYLSLYEKTFNKLDDAGVKQRNKDFEDRLTMIMVNFPQFDILPIELTKLLEDFTQKAFIKPFVHSKNSHPKTPSPPQKSMSKLSLNKQVFSGEKIKTSSVDLAELLKSKQTSLSTNRGFLKNSSKFDFHTSRSTKSSLLPNNLKRKDLALPPEKLTAKPVSLLRLIKPVKKAWDLVEPNIIDTEHEGIISAPLFIEESNLFVTAGKEGSIKVWDAAEFTLRNIIEGDQSKITCLKFAPKKNLLFVGCKEGIIKAIDLNSTSNPQYVLTGHQGSISVMEYVDEIDMLVSGGSSEQRALKYWNLNDHKIDHEFANGETEVHSLLYLKEEKLLIAGLAEGEVSIYQAVRKRLMNTIDTSFGLKHKNKDVIGIGYDRENKILYCGNIDGAFSAWNMVHSPPIPIRNFRNALRSARFEFLPSRKIVIIISKDKQIRIQDLMNGKNLNALSYQEDEGTHFCFLKEQSQILVTDLKSSNLKIWNLFES